MAEAVLRSFDQDLVIHSAGLEPADHISPVAIEVMAEIGIDLKPSVPKNFSEFKNYAFDYLITVGEGTNEEIQVPDINYNRKLHLGFKSPYKNSSCQEETKEKCREVRDEIMAELDYFYYKILKKSVC